MEISTITGKPVQSSDEKLQALMDMLFKAKSMGGQFVDHIMRGTKHAPGADQRVHGEYSFPHNNPVKFIDQSHPDYQPSIFSETNPEMMMGELDPPGIKPRAVAKALKEGAKYVKKSRYVVGSETPISQKLMDDLGLQPELTRVNAEGSYLPHQAEFKTKGEAQQLLDNLFDDKAMGKFTTQRPDAPGVEFKTNAADRVSESFRADPVAGVAERVNPLEAAHNPKNLGQAIKGTTALDRLGFKAKHYVGDIDAPRTVREAWGKDLSPEAEKYYGSLRYLRNKTPIHINGKTKLSVDFSTNCPKQLSGKGSCAYCYVDQGRTAQKLGIPAGNNPKKSGVETPYTNELRAMPADMVNEFNRDGGLRMFSSGDYRAGIDDQSMTNLLRDAQEKGLMLKAITKQPEFVAKYADHPNMRINISVDDLPADMSNAPPIEEAVKWAGGRDNVKIRSVAVTEAEAFKQARDPRIDVVTMYHGPVGDRLWQIVKAQNPEMVKKAGAAKVKKALAKWQTMEPKTQAFKRVAAKHGKKLCCQGGKCFKDKTKCGFGIGGLLIGVHLPEMDFEE